MGNVLGPILRCVSDIAADQQRQRYAAASVPQGAPPEHLRAQADALFKVSCTASPLPTATAEGLAAPVPRAQAAAKPVLRCCTTLAVPSPLQQRNAAFEQSKACYARGDHAGAKHYSNLGKDLDAQAKAVQKQAGKGSASTAPCAQDAQVPHPLPCATGRGGDS